MCIFSQPIESVKDTQIFARLTGKGTQLLAYQMSYESVDENAMILPVPIKQPATQESMNFIDLENYPDLFGDFAHGFPQQFRGSLGCSMESKSAVDSLSLPVTRVGNYVASFVPTLSDFDRLDEQFKLADEVWAKIPEYANFGFAVFQLAAGHLKPHPMAFEFKNQVDELFFPTIHIHDGEIHEQEHFDHILYMQHAGIDSSAHPYKNPKVEDKSTGLVRSKFAASNFCDIDRSRGLVEGDLLIHRKFMRGQLNNSDTVFPCSGDPLRPSINIGRWLSYAPMLIVFAAIGWFFNRRSKIKKTRRSKQTETSAE